MSIPAMIVGMLSTLYFHQEKDTKKTERNCVPIATQDERKQMILGTMRGLQYESSIYISNTASHTDSSNKANGY